MMAEKKCRFCIHYASCPQGKKQQESKLRRILGLKIRNIVCMEYREIADVFDSVADKED